MAAMVLLVLLALRGVLQGHTAPVAQAALAAVLEVAVEVPALLTVILLILQVLEAQAELAERGAQARVA
jgi:hypothetical protein